MGLVPSPKILVIRFNNGSGRFSSIISFSPHYRISNGDLQTKLGWPQAESGSQSCASFCGGHSYGNFSSLGCFDFGELVQWDNDLPLSRWISSAPGCVPSLTSFISSTSNISNKGSRLGSRFLWLKTQFLGQSQGGHSGGNTNGQEDVDMYISMQLQRRRRLRHYTL